MLKGVRSAKGREADHLQNFILMENRRFIVLVGLTKGMTNRLKSAKSALTSFMANNAKKIGQKGENYDDMG